MTVSRLSLFAGKSPPSRAAWIEIGIESRKINLRGVAAFTGGVD